MKGLAYLDAGLKVELVRVHLPFSEDINQCNKGLVIHDNAAMSGAPLLVYHRLYFFFVTLNLSVRL